jgi:hypothetical protein
MENDKEVPQSKDELRGSKTRNRSVGSALKQKISKEGEEPLYKYRSVFMGKKGQTKEQVKASAISVGYEFGKKGKNWHYAKASSGEQNVIHAGAKPKCKFCKASRGKSTDYAVSNDNKIILATPSTDSRQPGAMAEKGNIRYFTVVHIRDVQHLMMQIINYMMQDALTHDWTKLSNTDDFVRNMQDAKEGKKFYDGKWWNLHRSTERHHAIDFSGEHDINLMDVLHMLCDWIAAGNARGFKGVTVEDSLKRVSGKVDLKDFLYNAFINSFNFINSGVSVEREHQLSQPEVEGTDEVNLPKTSIQSDDVVIEPSQTPDLKDASADAPDIEQKAVPITATNSDLTDEEADVPGGSS